MSAVPIEFRNLILELLQPEFDRSGLSPDDVAEGDNLLDLKLVDSFAFLELITGLEERTGVILDFADIEPSELISIEALARHFS